MQNSLKESTITVQVQKLQALTRTEKVIQTAQSLSNALTRATLQNIAPLPQAIGALLTPEPSQVTLPKQGVGHSHKTSAFSQVLSRAYQFFCSFSSLIR